MYFSDFKARCGSDLALERHRADTDLAGVELRRERASVGVWERIKISTEAAAASIERPIGHYHTLTLPDMHTLDLAASEDAKDEISRELCRLCEYSSILPDRILVVGLGARDLTPDSVGPLTAQKVSPTMHIRQMDEAAFLALDCSEIAVIAPGVSASTGIDTAEIVKGVVRRILPDLVIAVDSLAARSPERLGKTIQLSDTGILPGSGLGRHSSAISLGTLGVPVFALGVPTVISSEFVFASESAEQFFVSPKDINPIVNAAAEIIGGGINQAFGICY